MHPLNVDKTRDKFFPDLPAPLEHLLLYSVPKAEIATDEMNIGRCRMFRVYIRSTVCLSVLVLVAAAAMAQGGPGYGRQRGAGRGDGSCIVASMPLQSLEDNEKSDLLYMREEEKLARDVYLKLYARWSDPVFLRISQSEQRHMDAVGTLLDRYALGDPVQGRGEGEFSHPELQQLYLRLAATGEQSYIDALKIGATIEDLDLFDLGESIAATDNEDIKAVYANLQNGSGNHMRAFVGKLEALGEGYTAQYMGDAALSAILASQNASGAAGAGRGRRARNGGGPGNGMCIRALNAGTK
jgi:hypothetical protein